MDGNGYGYLPVWGGIELLREAIARNGGNKKIFSPDSSNKCDQKDPLQSLSLTHHLLPPVHSIHFSSSSIFDFGGFRKNLCCLYALSFINIGQSILQIRLEIRFSLH